MKPVTVTILSISIVDKKPSRVIGYKIVTIFMTGHIYLKTFCVTETLETHLKKMVGVDKYLKRNCL